MAPSCSYLIKHENKEILWRPVVRTLSKEKPSKIHDLQNAYSEPENKRFINVVLLLVHRPRC